MNTKLHAVTDARGRPISFFMTAGQVSDYTGAAALLDGLPKADWLLGDRGYDADWFRDALEEKGITPCIPGRKSRNKPVKYDKRRYKSRNKIEIMFGRLKDWRRVATGRSAASQPISGGGNDRTGDSITSYCPNQASYAPRIDVRYATAWSTAPAGAPSTIAAIARLKGSTSPTPHRLMSRLPTGSDPTGYVSDQTPTAQWSEGNRARALSSCRSG